MYPLDLVVVHALMQPGVFDRDDVVRGECFACNQEEGRPLARLSSMHGHQMRISGPMSHLGPRIIGPAHVTIGLPNAEASMLLLFPDQSILSKITSADLASP